MSTVLIVIFGLSTELIAMFGLSTEFIIFGFSTVLIFVWTLYIPINNFSVMSGRSELNQY